MIARLGDKFVKVSYSTLPKLPSAYQEVEYIYTTGWECIISFGLQWNTNIMFFNSGRGSTTPFIAYSRADGVTAVPSPAINTLLDLKFHTITFTTTSSSTNIITTSSWNGWWERVDYGEQKFYDSNDDLIGDFIPCISKSDNRVGFYDLVTNSFFDSSSTWGLKFIAGPSFNLPEEYQEVEYIESSGTQYIDTGYLMNQDGKIDITFTDLGSLGTSHTIFCNDRTSGSDIVGLVVNDFFVKFGSQTNAYNINNYQTNTKYNLTLDKSQLTLKTNETTTYQTSVSTNDFSSTKSLLLFAARTSADVIIQYSTMRLFRTKLYSSGSTLVRNLIPCYRKADNEIGLYDLVSNTFFTNAGTGTFTKGNNAEAVYSTLCFKIKEN